MSYRRVTRHKRRKRSLSIILIIAATIAANSSVVVANIIKNGQMRRPYHTSKLAGGQWVRELLLGHPQRINSNLGLRKRCFRRLVSALERKSGLHLSKKGITTNEQVAIFLYTVATGLTMRRVAERFQRSMSTIHRYVLQSNQIDDIVGSPSHREFFNCSYFYIVIDAILNESFYNSFVRLPGPHEPTSQRIASNAKFADYFADCLGAMDGSHIYARVSPSEHTRYRDRHTNISQNVLAMCSFDELFTFIMSGWEGSAGDGLLYNAARRTSLAIPPNKYVLADAAFPSCPSVLVPYRGVHYHLQEWGRANLRYSWSLILSSPMKFSLNLDRPANSKELFNLRHASLRNVIERIFGILKRCFRILLCVSPELPKEAQAKLIPALCCLHNFRRLNDDDVEFDWDPETESVGDVVSLFGSREAYIELEAQYELSVGDLKDGVTANDVIAGDALRDAIATHMWDDYVHYLAGDHP